MGAEDISDFRFPISDFVFNRQSAMGNRQLIK